VAAVGAPSEGADAFTVADNDDDGADGRTGAELGETQNVTIAPTATITAPPSANNHTRRPVPSNECGLTSLRQRASGAPRQSR
jgi:hypothetical protein